MSFQDLMPNKISHSHEVYVIVTTIFTFLATLAVILRLVSRLLTFAVKWDDWACICALIFSYGCLITAVLDAVVGRGGYDFDLYSKATLAKYLQITLAGNMLYVASVTLSRVSMLLFYQRIFSIKRPFRIASWIVGFLISSFFFIGEFGLMFANNPIDGQWKVWIPSASIGVLPFWIAQGVLDMVLDFIILSLPQPLVWNLKMNSQRKLLLSGLFSLGGVVCVASILRLIYLAEIDLNNATATEVRTAIWQSVEINVSIICSCLPTFPSLIRHFRKDSQKSSSEVHLKPSESEHRSIDKVHHVHNENTTSGYVMGDLGSVHVQKDFRVNWDRESQSYSESTG